MLWTKVDSTHTMSSQARMEFEFGRRHVAAQFLGTFEDFPGGSFMH